MRRRQFLKATAATAAAPVVLGRRGQAADPYAAKPDHVSLEYDEATLQKYRPRLITRHLEIKPSYLYGWVARSNEFDTEIACYWAWYEGQQASVQAASHRADREPVYVVFDPDSGDVQEAVVDGYHYFAARYTGDAVPFQDGDEYRPTFHVQKPYHFYSGGGDGGEDVDLKDMNDRYPDWWKNDWHVHQRSVVVPWVMTGSNGRSDWWPDDVGSWSYEAALRDAYYTVGWYGADDVDDGALVV